MAYAVRSAVGDVAAELHQHDKPGLDVDESFAALVPLELVVLDARHVILDPSNGPTAVRLCQEPGRHGDVRKQPKNGNRPGDGCAPKDEKDGLHPCQLAALGPGGARIQSHLLTFQAAMPSTWPMP